MKRIALLVLVACGSKTPPASSRLNDEFPPKPKPGDVVAFDPPRPELRLPRHFTPTRYTAKLAIDPAKPTFEGQIQIDGNLDRPSAVIWLHGKHLDVTAGKATDGTHEVALKVTGQGDLLEVRPDKPLAAGHWQLALTYRGQIEQNGFEGAFISKLDDVPYIFTQFEATAARLVFPCIDEPDRKAPWQLTLDVPKGLVTTSNTMPTGTVSLDATHERIAFAVTRPLPSYLIAFASGPFEIVDAGKTTIPLRVITPKGTAKKAAYLASSLPKIIGTLETWFGIPFPYPKLDIVMVPSMRGGAMENAGMITFDAHGALLDNPSPREKYGIISTVGHESSHQWFGDLVTAAWWDDIWLNESFASWMEDKVLSQFDPSWPLEAQTYRESAFTADTLASARKIRQPIENEGDIHNAFDNITYPKGSTVLRMLEHQLGEAAFQKAIHGYVLAHADGNATAADLFAALDGAGRPLGKLVSGWFDQPGVPAIEMTLACDGTPRIQLSQERFMVESKDLWTVPVCVAFENAKHERVDRCTVLEKAKGQIELPSCPAWFAPAGDYGYYRAKLDAKAIDAIRDKGWGKLTSDEHIAIYSDVYEYAMLGEQPLALYGSLTAKLARGDAREVGVSLGDFYVAGYASGYPWQLQTALTPALLPAARARVSAIAEPLFRKLGFVNGPKDSIATIDLRTDAIQSLMWSRSHAMDAQAKQLFAHWRDLPNDEMASVLVIVANSDAKLAAQLRASVFAEKDPTVQRIILEALEAIHDPGRHHEMLESLIGDPKLLPEDLTRMFANYGGEEGRADDEAYIRAHFDELVKRIPNGENDDFPLVLILMRPFANACDPDRAAEIRTYVEAHFSKVPSGARPTQQGLERLDQCVARKKLLEPSLRAWLK